ncbi:hypothetical protein Droror1_Dr00015451 [Drosera rotundifolia]
MASTEHLNSNTGGKYFDYSESFRFHSSCFFIHHNQIEHQAITNSESRIIQFLISESRIQVKTPNPQIIDFNQRERESTREINRRNKTSIDLNHDRSNSNNENQREIWIYANQSSHRESSSENRIRRSTYNQFIDLDLVC